MDNANEGLEILIIGVCVVLAFALIVYSRRNDHQ